MRRNLSVAHGGKVYRVWSGGRHKKLKDYCRIFQHRPPDLRIRRMCVGCPSVPGWPQCPDYDQCDKNKPKQVAKKKKAPPWALTEWGVG